MKKNKLILIIALIIIGLGLLFFGYRMFNFYQGEQKLKEAALSYYEANPSFLPKENNQAKEVSLKVLRDKSLVDSIIFTMDKDSCDESSFVRVIKENDKYTYKIYLKCKNMTSNFKITGPEIVLNGEESILLGINKKYEEQGIKNENSFIKGSLKIDSSKLNTLSAGNYEVVYTAYDKNYNKITAKRKVVVAKTLENVVKDSLGDNSLYKGIRVQNFINYSGIDWRIIGINEDNTIKVVANDEVNTLGLGSLTGSYIGSSLEKWLNNDFYNTLSNKEKFVKKDSKWCVYSTDNYKQAYNCQEKDYYQNPVATLNSNDYLMSIENDDSYIKTISAFHVMTLGNSNNEILVNRGSHYFLNNNKQIVGVRPVINLNSNFMITGTGDALDPFMFVEETNKKKSNASDLIAGDLVSFANLRWIVSKKEENNISLILSENLSNNDIPLEFKVDYTYNENKLNEQGQLLNYLNNEFLNNLNKNILVKKKYQIPTITNFDLFDYKNVETDNEYYVFIPSYGDLYNTQIRARQTVHSSIFMLKRENTDNVSYYYIQPSAFGIPITQVPNDQLSVVVRPKITIEGISKIKGGNGSYETPYQID